MAFPCPGCGAAVAADPESWALRCPSCRRLMRSRALESDGPHRAYEVEIVGQPETRRRIDVAWGENEGRRLGAWLLWSSLLTVGLVVVLYALARLTR
jgi:hypothetical protein